MAVPVSPAENLLSPPARSLLMLQEPVLPVLLSTPNACGFERVIIIR